MLIRILIILLFAQFAHAQTSPVLRVPSNGENGYNGSIPRSFIIQWDSLANVSYYEYVVSDNSLCFAGCSGDTRHDLVAHTYALEKNLVLNKWYYWIVRAVMKDGDTTFYSQINSFYTSPRPEDLRTYFTLSPNRVPEGTMDIRVAWTIDPDITNFDFKLYDSFGQLIKTSESIALKKNELEQTEVFRVDVEEFHTGLYFVEINTNLSKVPERFKFLIVQ